MLKCSTTRAQNIFFSLSFKISFHLINSSTWLREGAETHMVNPFHESKHASKKHNRQVLWSVRYFMTQCLFVCNLQSINPQTKEKVHKQVKCTFVSYSPPFLQRSWLFQRNLFHLNDYILYQLDTKIRTDVTFLQEGVNSWFTQENNVACSTHRLLHTYMYVVPSCCSKTFRPP
jgi:hypothetical protein